jgi:hypothetical protein
VPQLEQTLKRGLEFFTVQRERGHAFSQPRPQIVSQRAQVNH